MEHLSSAISAHLSMIQLTHPGWLLGLLALGLPVLIHLWSRRSGPAMAWPWIGLIRRAEQNRAKRDRLRDLLLLGLRCGVLAALVLSFAQPIWQTAPSLAGPQDPAALDPSEQITVILIDDSLSMNRTLRGRTLLERSCERANQILSDLPAGASSLVVSASQLERGASLPVPSTSRAYWRETVGEVEPTMRHFDLALLARQLVAGLPERVRDRAGLVVLTDDQASTWESALGSPVPLGIPVTIEHLRGGETSNFALASPRLVGGSGESSWTLSVTVSNYTNADHALPLLLEIDGLPNRLTPEIPAASTQTISLPLSVNRRGRYPIALTIQQRDALAADNRLALEIEVPDRAVAALIRPTDPSDAPSTSDRISDYLARALATSYRVVEVEAETNALLKLAASPDRPALWVVSPAAGERLSDSAAWLRIWREIVATGGVGMVWLPELAAELDWLPMQTAADPGERVAGRLAGLDWRSPPWRAFSGESGAALREMRFAHPPRITLAEDATVLAYFENNAPALAWREVGSGQLLAAGWSLLADDLAMTRSPLFVPLLIEPLERLRRDDRPLLPSYQLGQPVRVRLPASLPSDTALRLLSPSGPIAAAEVRGLPGEQYLTLPAESTTEPGWYRIATESGDALGGFLVEIDPRASDLRALSDAAPAEIAPRLIMAAGETDTPVALGRVGRVAADGLGGIPLWPWTLLLAVVLMMLESLIAGRLALPGWPDRSGDHVLAGGSIPERDRGGAR